VNSIPRLYVAEPGFYPRNGRQKNGTDFSGDIIAIECEPTFPRQISRRGKSSRFRRFWHILQVIWRVAPVTGMEEWDRVCLVVTARQRAAQPILNQICTMSKFWFITGTSCGLRGAGRVVSSDRFEIAAARTGLSSASTHREHL